MVDTSVGPATITRVTVNDAALVAVPPAVVTVILPVAAPTGTIRFSVVAEVTVKVATTPLTAVADAAPTFAPVTVTTVPTGPDVAAKPVMVGRAVPDSVTDEVLITLPPGVVTVIFVLVTEPAGTPTTMLVAEITVNRVARTVPNLTAVAPVKFVPVIVTTVPIATDVGAKLVMVGAAT